MHLSAEAVRKLYVYAMNDAIDHLYGVNASKDKTLSSNPYVTC